MKNDAPASLKTGDVRILLTGTYCSKNKGDAAMQEVFATVMRERMPAAVITIASPFPQLDAAYYAPFPLLRSRRRNLPLAGLHWVLLEVMRMVGYKPSRYPLDSEIDAMMCSDVVVDLSGDMLTEDYGPLVGFSHFLPLLQALAMKRPLAICAQSVGPFRRLAPLARWIFSRASLVTVREAYSLGLLEELGGVKIAAIQTADLAFMLRPSTPERVDQILAVEGVNVGNRPLLGVSVSALLANRTNRHLEGAAEDKIVIFAEALDRVVGSRGIQVVLVSHVFGPKPSGDDRLVAERVASKMRHPVHIVRGEYRPEEIKGIIASCDYFVGCRMHANIAALDSGIPVVGVGYSHKTLGIMADLGLEDWVVGVEGLSADHLAATIELLIDQASEYRQQLLARLPETRRRSRQNIEMIATIIEENLRGES
jgi:colanic acid/amylovoran biosynthesis protein